MPTLPQATTTLLLLFLACSSSESNQPGAEAKSGGLGARLVFAVNFPPQSTTPRAEVLDQALMIVRNRIDQLELREPSVRREGERIVVEFLDADPGAVERAEQVVTRSAELRFRLAIHDHPGMLTLCQLATNQLPGPGPTVSAEKDAWINQQSGHNVSDCYLAAPNRALLSDYVATHATELALSPAQTIVYEEQAADRDRPEPGWRTHVINRTSVLTGAHVRNANAELNPETGRPEVRLEFNDDGRRLFAFITENKIGDKLVMTLNDRVISAPLIRDKVSGGVSVISLGGTDPTASQRQARELVDAIRSGALPAPLRLESAVSFDLK